MSQVERAYGRQSKWVAELNHAKNSTWKWDTGEQGWGPDPEK